MNNKMKIVVIGGSGLIGSKVVNILRQRGHEVVAASPSTGVNTLTGEGLADALTGAQVVVDLANSPSFEDKAVLEFFQTSGRNLHAAEAAAGVQHHVALSIVGTDRTPDNGYFRAKVAQEKLIEASGIPYTIIRSTQFLEFLGAIAASSADGNMVRLSPGLFQPIAADDVAAIVADVALAAPRNGIVEIAGRVEERSLVPLGEARLGTIGLAEWLRRQSESPNQPSQTHGRQAIVRGILCALTLAFYPIGGVLADAQMSAAEIVVHGSHNAKVTLVYEHELPNVPGKSVKGVLVEYGPGGSSVPHTHPASAFIYATVLEGAIVSKVNDGPETVYRAGESWSEQPGDRHAVSRNASSTEQARLLAVFFGDTAEN